MPDAQDRSRAEIHQMLFQEIADLRSVLEERMVELADLAKRLEQAEDGSARALADSRQDNGRLRAEGQALQVQVDRLGAELTQLRAENDRLRAERTVPSADLTRMNERHRLEITLLHTLYASWNRGPASGVPDFSRQVEIIATTPLFDVAWYQTTYPDVAASGLSPREHYVRSGAFEGRNPGPGFDTMAYYLANPDVAQAGWPALVHYVGFGKAEGRKAA